MDNILLTKEELEKAVAKCRYDYLRIFRFLIQGSEDKDNVYGGELDKALAAKEGMILTAYIDSLLLDLEDKVNAYDIDNK